MREFWSERVLAKDDRAANIGFVDEVIKFIIIDFRLPLKRSSSLKIKQPIDDRIREFFRHAETEGSLRNTEVLSDTLLHSSYSIDWVWMETELTLVRSLFHGFAICFPLSFVIMLLATHSFSVAFVGAFTIGAIVCTILGGAYLAGEELGVLLTVAGIIVIGFSVDYTVHLGIVFAEAHKLSSESRRTDRFRIAFGTMGATVIAGAITTGAAGLAMLPCVLLFLTKMVYKSVLRVWSRCVLPCELSGLCGIVF